MDSYLRQILENVNGIIQDFVVKQIISRIEDLAHGHGGRHTCQSYVDNVSARRQY